MDEDLASDGTFENARTYVQNWRHDVVAMLSSSGTVNVASKQDYTSYGEPPEIWAADISKDGKVDVIDFGVFGSANNSVYGDANYNALADYNKDGAVDIIDFGIFGTEYNNGLSLKGPLDAAFADRGYAGYVSDTALESVYHVRHRVYDADAGRWTRRDPIVYVGGSNVYQYSGSRPVVLVDSTGLLGQVSYEVFQSSVWSNGDGDGTTIPEGVQLTQIFSSSEVNHLTNIGGFAHWSKETNTGTVSANIMFKRLKGGLHLLVSTTIESRLDHEFEHGPTPHPNEQQRWKKRAKRNCIAFACNSSGDPYIIRHSYYGNNPRISIQMRPWGEQHGLDLPGLNEKHPRYQMLAGSKAIFFQRTGTGEGRLTFGASAVFAVKNTLSWDITVAVEPDLGIGAGVKKGFKGLEVGLGLVSIGLDVLDSQHVRTIIERDESIWYGDIDISCNLITDGCD